MDGQVVLAADSAWVTFGAALSGSFVGAAVPVAAGWIVGRRQSVRDLRLSMYGVFNEFRRAVPPPIMIVAEIREDISWTGGLFPLMDQVEASAAAITKEDHRRALVLADALTSFFQDAETIEMERDKTQVGNEAHAAQQTISRYREFEQVVLEYRDWLRSAVRISDS